MNAGAKEATGDLLLFMHADSRLSPESFDRMTEKMFSGEPSGGAFGLTIESEKNVPQAHFHISDLALQNISISYTAIRPSSSVQTCFVSSADSSPLPICEDLEFFRRLSRRGKVILLEEKVHTSARRWMAEGVLFTALRNITIATLFLLGFPPRILSKWYLVVR